MSVALWPSSRVCAACAESFFPKSTVQVYCSAKCRERAKYERVRNDPERWAAYLTRLRSQYEPTGNRPGPAPTHTSCSADGCTEKHFARGFCRKHYRRDRYRRGLDRRRSPEIVAALVKHYADGEFVEEAQPRRITAQAAGSLLIPECPDCGRPMMKVPRDDMDLHDCARCQVRVRLNSEEVSWLTSETPSIARSQPIKS